MDPLEGSVFGTPVNQGGVHDPVAGKGHPLLQAGKEIRGKGFASLDFDGQEKSRFFHQKIDFRTPAIPPEIKGSGRALREEEFPGLGHHESLEDVPPQE